jgi:hypothetical protein
MERWSFTAHPASVGETYGQHFCSACRFSPSMICAGIACFLHGVFSVSIRSHRVVYCQKAP